MTLKSLIKPFWMWTAIFLTVLALGLHVRFYPLRAHVWSDSTQRATVFILMKIKSVLAEQINTQRPDLPQAQRNALIEQRFAQTLHNDAVKVRHTIAQAAQSLHEASPDGPERVYLQEADGYYYYDLTQNIAKTGKMATQFEGSKYLNEKMAAPFGFWQPLNLHPYTGFVIYKVLSIFNHGFTLFNAACYTGPFLSALALAAFIWVCYVLRLSPLASFIGAAYFYLAPIFVKRSTFAWYDDDSHNLLFALLIVGVIFQALKCVRDRRSAIRYGIIASLLFAVYALFWHGWGYLFIVALVSGAVILVIHHVLDRHLKPYLSFPRKQESNATLGSESITQKEEIRFIDPDLGLFFLTIFLGTLVVVSLIFGVGGFVTIFQDAFGELRKFMVNQLSLWPNLFVAVGELKRSSMAMIVTMTGNPLSFLGALLSVPFIGYIAYNRRDRVGLYQLILLTVLLLVDLKITLGAERFILLCLVPLSLLFTIGLSRLIELLRTLIHPMGTVPEKPNGLEIVVGILLAMGLVFFPVRSINTQIPELLNPIFNSTWEAALLDIKAKTPPDSIITTWWPPGHFIKAIANRRVTFDGATLSKNKEAYWVANILLTSDERKAAGILRMLNISGTKAIDYLESVGINTSDAVALLHLILPLSGNEAAKALSKILPEAAAENLLSMTHGTKIPPSYLLIYSELMEKNIGLQFVGKWNFRQIEALNKDPRALKTVPAANSPDFFEFLWKTIGGPYKYSEALVAIAQDGEHIEFDQGLSIDLATMSAVMASQKFGSGVPLSIVYSDGSKIVEKKFPEHNLNYTIVLFKENTRYYVRLMDQELANSLLVKFFIFKGQGMELFKPLSLQSDMTGRDEVDVFELMREKI